MVADKSSLLSSSSHMQATRFIWVPQACNTFLSTTSFGVCTQKVFAEIVTLSELKNPLLCNKFHCFQNVLTAVPFFFFFSQHATDWTMGSQHSEEAFLMNELFMG